MRELLLLFWAATLLSPQFSIRKCSVKELGLPVANSYAGPIQQSIQRVKIAPAQEPLQ